MNHPALWAFYRVSYNRLWIAFTTYIHNSILCVTSCVALSHHDLATYLSCLQLDSLTPCWEFVMQLTNYIKWIMQIYSHSLSFSRNGNIWLQFIITFNSYFDLLNKQKANSPWISSTEARLNSTRIDLINSCTFNLPQTAAGG